eukprot:4153145-Prymnesium_polylepis.1
MWCGEAAAEAAAHPLLCRRRLGLEPLAEPRAERGVHARLAQPARHARQQPSAKGRAITC